MRYLLDTCCISDFVKGDGNTLRQVKRHVPADLAISAITVMEIQYGLMLSPNKTKTIKSVMNDVISSITILPYNESAAQCSAEIRALLKKQGNPIGSYDLLMAGMALSHNLILVTANEKEFNRVADLKIENWRHAVELVEIK